MDNLRPPARFIRGQSLNDTAPPCKAGGIAPATGVMTVTMSLTILLGLFVLAGSVRADDTQPHVAAVAVARAQILSGVRIGQGPVAVDAKKDRREAPLPKPRERPCPDDADTRCRLIVVDMP